MKYKTRFLLFFVAMALFHLAANFAHPVTPTIIQELGLPDYMFGLMLAVMMIANFALSPSWGNINRFISSRESLLICCVGYAAAQLGFAYSTTQAGILFVRLLAGVFIGGVFVSMLTYVVNVAEPKDMAKYLTYSATLHSVFGAFGYLVGGVVGEFSIRAAFLLQAATLLVSGILFRLCCVPDGERTGKVSVKELIASGNPFDAFRDGKYFMNTAFVLLFLVNILINLGNTCFDQVFNYYLKDQLGLTSAYNGIIKAVVGFVSFLFNMTLCLWIIRKADTGKSTVVLVAVCTLGLAGNRPCAADFRFPLLRHRAVRRVFRQCPRIAGHGGHPGRPCPEESGHGLLQRHQIPWQHHRLPAGGIPVRRPRQAALCPDCGGLRPVRRCRGGVSGILPGW